MYRYAVCLAGALLLTVSPALAQKKPPPLKTAVDVTFAQHAMPRFGGDYKGLNIDLANQIGKRPKRKVIVDAVPFSGIVPASQIGTYEFVAAPTTVTKQRADY